MSNIEQNQIINVDITNNYKDNFKNYIIKHFRLTIIVTSEAKVSEVYTGKYKNNKYLTVHYYFSVEMLQYVGLHTPDLIYP